MNKLFRQYFSPYFLIRHYLKRDILKSVLTYKFSGTVIDIGCGQEPFRDLFTNSQYFGIDYENYSYNKDFSSQKPDFYFDTKYSSDLCLPFKNNQFDNAVSFQVLEHHPNPQKLISEMSRITKPHGIILVTCPFLYALHESPYDYQRFTHFGLKKLIKDSSADIKIKKIIPQGGLFSTISMLISERLNKFAAKNKVSYSIAILFMPFLLASEYLSIIIDKVFPSPDFATNYLLIMEKSDD